MSLYKKISIAMGVLLLTGFACFSFFNTIKYTGTRNENVLSTNNNVSELLPDGNTNENEGVLLSQVNFNKKMPDGSTATIYLDRQAFSSFKKMKTEANSIIVGTVKGIEGSVNLERNPYNPAMPDNEHPALAKKYRVEVEDAIKDNVNKEIIVVQESTITDRSGNTYSFADSNAEIPLKIGSRYILFLAKDPGVIAELSGTYSAIGDPWIVELNNNRGRLISGNESILKYFNKDSTGEYSEKDLINELKNY